MIDVGGDSGPKILLQPTRWKLVYNILINNIIL